MSDKSDKAAKAKSDKAEKAAKTAQAHFDKALLWAKSKGLQKIKANVDDYETPSQFTRSGEDEPIIPDITGLQMGAKNYVEVATKSDDVEKKVSKWKLLGTMASMKGGSLYLLAPKGHKAFCDNVVKVHSLNAKVVYLK